MEDLGWVDVLGMCDLVDERLGFGEVEFSGGELSFQDRLGSVDGFGLGVSCHVGVLHGAR